MIKNAFYFSLKALFVLKVFKFLSSLFGREKKPLDQTDKIIFVIYDATAGLTMNYNTHIAQYLTNYRQPDNEIWSVNRIPQEKYFSLKIIQTMRQGN